MEQNKITKPNFNLIEFDKIRNKTTEKVKNSNFKTN